MAFKTMDSDRDRRCSPFSWTVQPIIRGYSKLRGARLEGALLEDAEDEVRGDRREWACLDACCMILGRSRYGDRSREGAFVLDFLPGRL